MGEADPEVQTEAVADVAYLSRFADRVRILGVLADRSVTRQELAAITGVSPTTVDRIVNEVEERDWAERTADGTYTATLQGTHFQRQLRPSLESVVAIRRLGDVVDWLPTEELTVGLEHFADAVVQRPARDDPVETAGLVVELVEGATEHHAFTHLVPPVALSEAIREGVESGRLTADGVLTGESIDFLRETPDRRDDARRGRDGPGFRLPRRRTADRGSHPRDDPVLAFVRGPPGLRSRSGRQSRTVDAVDARTDERV